MSRLFLLLAWAALPLMGSLRVGAAPAAEATDPVAFLRASVSEVLEIVASKDVEAAPLSERLRPILERHFDLAGITRRAVGAPWRRFSPDQQQQTVELFSTLVLRTYADRFEPKSTPAINFGSGVELAPGRWEVPTTIVYEGNTYSVAYRMQGGASGWRIYDVVIEGVSMVGNYRSQFDAIIKRGGADALLQALTENIERAKAAS